MFSSAVAVGSVSNCGCASFRNTVVFCTSGPPYLKQRLTVECETGNRKPVEKLTKQMKTVDLNRKMFTDWSLLTVTVNQPITASRWY